MSYALTWLPDVLKGAGLNVTETDGWKTRGHGDVRQIRGVMCHHTCGPKTGDIKDLGVLIAGRPDLQGPLCELGLGRSGMFYIVAAGKPWHAGAGNWQGITDGNANMIGIEAENTGLPDDPWPEVQMDAYRRGVAAILTHIGAKPIMCCGHREYALPHGRKDDPDFDMVEFRAGVAEIMGVAPPVIQTTFGSVEWVQLALNRKIDAGLDPDGLLGNETRKAIKTFQVRAGLHVTGVADATTLDALKA